MKLRDAKTEDLKPITNLIIRCSEHFILPRFGEDGKREYLLSHSLETMRERLEQFQYQVLEQNDEIIGVVGMRRPSHLFHLHVAPEYHGQGLGKHLWNAAKARALQLDQPDKFTVNSSIYAVPFYEKLGFVAGSLEIRGGVEYVPMSMKQSNFKIRLAVEQEASSLSELASRSKSYWPYDEEYLKLCRTVTHVTCEDIQKWPFIVATENDFLCGFSAVCEVKGEKMLDHLWIDPPYIGRGLGRILFLEGMAKAKELGWRSFTIASDPYAEPFYKRMGAKRIGERESKIKKGFFLPLLEMKFE